MKSIVVEECTNVLVSTISEGDSSVKTEFSFPIYNNTRTSDTIRRGKFKRYSMLGFELSGWRNNPADDVSPRQFLHLAQSPIVLPSDKPDPIARFDRRAIADSTRLDFVDTTRAGRKFDTGNVAVRIITDHGPYPSRKDIRFGMVDISADSNTDRRETCRICKLWKK